MATKHRGKDLNQPSARTTRKQLKQGGPLAQHVCGPKHKKRRSKMSKNKESTSVSCKCEKSKKHPHCEDVVKLTNDVTMCCSEHTCQEVLDNVHNTVAIHAPTRQKHTRTKTIERFSRHLNCELLRLQTFKRYPGKAHKSALVLAESGYIYTGTGEDDHVTCVFCGMKYSHWKLEDIVEEIHRRLSAHCSMVTGVDCPNIPFGLASVSFDKLLVEIESRGNSIETDSRLSAQAEQQARFEAFERSLPEKKDFESEANSLEHAKRADKENSDQEEIISEALALSSNINNLSSNNPNTVASQSYLPGASLTLQNSSVASSIRSQRQITTATTLDYSTSGNSQLAINSMATTASATSTPISAEHQNTTSIATLQPSRQESSINQSDQHNQVNQPNQPNQPNESNQPSTRHPTYSELGIITERPKRTEYALTSERLKSFSNWPRDHFLQPSSLVDAGFYYGGYGDCARCFYCGGGLRNWEDEDDVWVEHARWFSKCAFIRNKMGQAFVDAVKDLNETHDKITFEMVVNKLGGLACFGQLDPRENPLRFDPAVKTMIDLGYKESDVMQAATMLKEKDVPMSADDLLECLKQEMKIGILKIEVHEQQTMDEEDLENLRQLKDKNQQLRQQTVCKMCLDREVSVVFLPCGHLVSCTECSSAVKNCPICRTGVKGIVRAFLM